MDVIDSIKEVFDKSCISEACGLWEVDERAEGASFKKLVVHDKSTCFHVIPNKVYKMCAGLTSRNSSFIEDEDCDGVSFIRKDSGTYLMLVELKSTLASEKIEKALKQIVFTYLKLHMMMSVCQGGEINNYKILGVIACHPAKNAQQADYLQLQYLNIEEANPDMKWLARLYYEGKMECEIGKMYFVGNAPLHDLIKKKRISFVLKTFDTTHHSSAETDVSSLLS